MGKWQQRFSIAFGALCVLLIFGSRLAPPEFRFAIQAIGVIAGGACLIVMYWLGPVAEGEDRKVFVSSKSTALPTAQIDFGVGASSIFAAIGVASLASDLIRWRDFFASFLDAFDQIGRALIALLPFHVPPEYGPSLILTLALLGVLYRFFYLLVVKTGLSPLAGFALAAIFTIAAPLQLTTARSPQSALTLILTIIGLQSIMGLIGLFAKEASGRLTGFYMLQTTGWCVLWGLVILFIGADIVH